LRRTLAITFPNSIFWLLGQQHARITIDNLDSLKPGFGSYFDKWLTYQEQLWNDESLEIAREEVDGVLSILAFALGPLESRDLLGLMKEIYRRDDLSSEHRLLQPLRRFIIGNGRAGSGYVLSHPKIADYLQNERFGANANALRQKFGRRCTQKPPDSRASSDTGYAGMRHSAAASLTSFAPTGTPSSFVLLPCNPYGSGSSSGSTLKPS